MHAYEYILADRDGNARNEISESVNAMIAFLCFYFA